VKRGDPDTDVTGDANRETSACTEAAIRWDSDGGVIGAAPVMLVVLPPDSTMEREVIDT
jgi:hypothetical protein